MAISGRKPKATVVKLVTGNPGRRPLNAADPMPTDRPRPPIRMSGRPAALWKRYIAKAWWLADADSPKAWLWCELQAQAEADPVGFLSARIAQLRALGSELGLDPASRARMGTPPASNDPAARFFD